MWDAVKDTGIDAYELHDPDVLHLFWSGMFRYALKDMLVVLKRLGGDAAVHELDVRAQKLYRYVVYVLGG